MADMKVEINNAIVGHSLWKQRLKQAVDMSTSDFTPAEVEQDQLCAFGKWWFGLPLEQRATPLAQEIETLHADFHQEAGRILRLALTEGGKPEAQKALEFNGVYARLSSDLVARLTKLKEI